MIPKAFGHGNDFLGGEARRRRERLDDTVSPGFEGCGDCAWAGPAHETMGVCKDAGRPVPDFTGDAVVAEYEAYSGYNRQTGANDNGSTCVTS